MSDLEEDTDPIQSTHTDGATPDDGNDALFAAAYLRFGVKAHVESMEADAAAEEDPPPEPKKKKRRFHPLACDAAKE
jgi:hypothetical protein